MQVAPLSRTHRCAWRFLPVERTQSVRSWLLAVVMAAFFGGVVLSSAPCLAGEGPQEVPHRFGVAVTFAQGVGLSDNYGMGLATLVGLFDYDRVWPHRAPDGLRFKVELTAGSTTWPEAPRAVVSANILALYYLDSLAGSWWRPYAEAGIGGIFTDFQVKGQGSRINFNPVAGFGLEFPTAGGPTWFTAIRASHYSNAGILDDNQGVNTFGTMLGIYF